jgi:hypothetical protein
VRHTLPPLPRPGLAAAKHAQRQQQRAAAIEALRDHWRFLRALAGEDERPDANEAPQVCRVGGGGPMSRYELYLWHRTAGTLWKFFAMFPR